MVLVEEVIKTVLKRDENHSEQNGELHDLLN
jgi:hypothetical protein